MRVFRHTFRRGAQNIQWSEPQTSKLLRSSTTHRHRLPVDELRLEVPATVPLERADMIEIHDVRAMHAHEPLGIESLSGCADNQNCFEAPIFYIDRNSDDNVRPVLEPN